MEEPSTASPKEDAVQESGEQQPLEARFRVKPCPFAVLGLSKQADSTAVLTTWLGIQKRFDQEGGSEARYLMQASAASWILNATMSDQAKAAEGFGWKSVGYIKPGTLEHDILAKLTSSCRIRCFTLEASACPLTVRAPWRKERGSSRPQWRVRGS